MERLATDRARGGEEAVEVPGVKEDSEGYAYWDGGGGGGDRRGESHGGRVASWGAEGREGVEKDFNQPEEEKEGGVPVTRPGTRKVNRDEKEEAREE
eukprot:3032536-Rhodomonas_salina.1